MDADKSKDNDTTETSAQGEVGDVEDAGETTAAGMISGPTDTKPVGADTMIKVSDAPEQKEEAKS
jgi:hypothetical protein